MKVWCISIAHNDISIIEDSIAQYYATKHPEVETVHIMVDGHWPIDYAAWRKRLDKLCEKFGIILYDPGKNLGLHGNWNYAWSRLNIPNNAMVIGYDCDSWPVTPGWDMAMCKVFVNDPNVGWISLWHQHSTREIDREGKKLKDEVIAGVSVSGLSHPCMNSVCGFRQGWLRNVGGLFEQNEFYGGLECDMWQKLMDQKMKWVFLRDFKEEPHFADRANPLYREWKWAYAHLKTTKDDFATWVKTHA